MKDGKKLNAIFLVVCMVLTALAVVSLPVSADEVSSGGTFVIYWLDGWMEDDPDLVSVDEPIVFNYDDNNNNLYYLGDESAEIEFRMRNNQVDDIWNVYIDLAILDTSIIDAAPDNRWPASGDYGNDVAGERFSGGSPGEWIDDDPTWDGLDNEPWFTIDIATSGNVNTLYQDALRITINYEDTSGVDSSTFVFDIYISSIFDDDTSGTQIDIHDDLPNLLEDDGTPEHYFEDYEEMQQGMITLTRHSGFTISEVETDLDLSGTGQDILATGGQTIAKIPSPPGATFTIYYRLDIGMSTPRAPVPPGIYTAQLQIQYVRDDTGQTIIESDRPIDLTVDYTPRLMAELETAVTINQGDLTADLSVRFYNAGNVDLTGLWIWSDEPDPAGDWWDLTFHHYENDDDTYEPQIQVGDLNSNSYSSYIPARVAADPRAPNGTHRLPFQWNGWVYEDGSTGDATRWVEMGGFMWDHDGFSSTPMVGRLYEDANEDMSYDPGEQVEDVWTGSYVDISVIDGNGVTMEGFVLTTLNAGFHGDVTYTTITVELHNLELLTYKDLECRLTVGANEPFLNPADHTANYLENDPLTSTTIGPWPATLNIPFTVDINVAWWQSNSLAPGVYIVEMMVDATNDDEEIRYTDASVDVRVSIDGFGPELIASAVSYEEITPGDNFTLSITIYNYGDDIARELDAYLRTDIVSGWAIVDQFATSLGGYAGEGGAPIGDASWGWVTDWRTYTMFNRSHDIRPSEIGVDNVPQIVELYDWISRRETPPQGEILWLHLNRLDPDTSHTFTFNMISDVNMVEGMAYYETLDLYYVDSNGWRYGPDITDPDVDFYTPPQQVLLRSGKGEEYTGEEEFDYSVVLYAIIFLIIAFIVFIIGFALGGRGRGPEPRMEEPPYEPYEEEYEPPPEPGPAPEEDIGPPLPEEPKPPE